MVTPQDFIHRLKRQSNHQQHSCLRKQWLWWSWWSWWWVNECAISLRFVSQMMIVTGYQGKILRTFTILIVYSLNPSENLTSCLHYLLWGAVKQGFFWTRELNIQTSKPKSQKFPSDGTDKKKDHKKFFWTALTINGTIILDHQLQLQLCTFCGSLFSFCDLVAFARRSHILEAIFLPVRFSTTRQTCYKKIKPQSALKIISTFK